MTTNIHYINLSKIVQIGWSHHVDFCVWTNRPLLLAKGVECSKLLHRKPFLKHYADVIMTTMASQIQTQIKENIKAPRHWPLCGEVTGTGVTRKMFPFDDVTMTRRATFTCRYGCLLRDQCVIYTLHMKTLPNIFRVTSPFFRVIRGWSVESPHKGQWRCFDFFLCSGPEQLSRQLRRRWFETPSNSSGHHCNDWVTV